MKKLLITGMNSLQTRRDGFLKQELQVVPSHYSVIRCLEDMGWTVEQRPVALGEDLSGYDEVIVYIHSIQAFCQQLYSGLYAIANRPNCIIAFDDWQIDQIYSSFSQYQKDIDDSSSEKAFREYLLELYAGPEDLDTIKKYRSDYSAACQIVLSKSNRLLVSAFDHGDLGLLNLGWNEDRVYRFNPNPYHLNRSPSNSYGDPVVGLGAFMDNDVGAAEKIRAWNFASLVQKKTQKWLKQQNVSKWDINYYGARRGTEVKQLRLTEADMCRVYNSQWGCLMPGYFHSGSGWWRARPLQVADAGSILVCEDKEGMVYGEAYVGLTAEKVENMSLEDLIATARRQKECLYAKHPLDKSVTKREFQSILEAAK
ncbi:hypothetical protein UFOVP247_172 [uncultured Caudovirales phage]|uniref:Uncharacterized protein n=1 Tax=uncultured Caudovirales phage TaxID=2100421 RepID=A0A6J7WU18_9CAUD|nr:hypothetical protein UFOVP247_172 [uncultured Caudovirales phage]